MHQCQKYATLLPSSCGGGGNTKQLEELEYSKWA